MNGTEIDITARRLAAAKARLSKAAAAVLANLPGSAAEADAARAEVDALLAAQQADAAGA